MFRIEATMKNFLMIITLLFTTVGATFAQTAPSVHVVGRDGTEKTKITDGDEIRLRAVLPALAGETTQVDFFIEGLETPLTTCAVSAGADACLSEPVPTLGWFWLPGHHLSATVRGQPLPGGLLLEIAPRPVVMVHGFLSNWETWQAYLGSGGYLAELGLSGFAVGDGQAPGVLNTGSPTNPAGKTNSIAQNALILDGYIRAVQQQTGAEQVDLLVHSMGGMITRYYLDRVMTTDVVAQVIFLGTPQSGSACVYPLASLGFLLPASIEIQPSYMDGVFNQQVTHRRGTPFHLVAGTRLIEPITSPCTQVPSDMVVDVNSATSIPLDSAQTIALVHGDLTTNRAVFDSAVKALLQAGPQNFLPHADPAAPALASGAEQFSRTFSGHINAGETREIILPIEPNVSLANFNLYDSSRSLQIEVRGASGNLITLDPQKNGLLLVNDPATMIYLGYGFAQPKPGAWTVKLISGDNTPAAGADFGLNARYTGGATLEAQTSPTIPAIGQAVTISAKLTADGQAITSTSSEARLRKPDGSSETLTLTNTDGLFSTTYTPATSGLYALELAVTAQTSAGYTINRAAYLSFEAQPGAQENQSNRNKLLFGLAGLAVLLFLFISLRWFRKKKTS